MPYYGKISDFPFLLVIIGYSFISKGGLDFSHPPVYNLLKKGDQMQDLMPSVKFNLFLC